MEDGQHDWGIVATNYDQKVRFTFYPDDYQFPIDDWASGVEFEFDLANSEGHAVVRHALNIGREFSQCPAGYAEGEEYAYFGAPTGTVHVAVAESTVELTLSNAVFVCDGICYAPPLPIILTVEQWTFEAPYTKCSVLNAD